MTRCSDSSRCVARSAARGRRAPAEQPGLLDGEGGAVGGELEEVAFVGGEVARGEAADVQDADDARLRRAAGRRAAIWMPFSRRIGLRMSAWSTSAMAIARRSAAMRPAKPRPSGMRDALLDLFLDALGGAGVQRVALEQQDRDGVDVQDLGDPLQQLLQQLLLRQERERGVGDPLQRLEHPPLRPRPRQRGGDVRCALRPMFTAGRSRKGHKTAHRPASRSSHAEAELLRPRGGGRRCRPARRHLGDVTTLAAAGALGLSSSGRPSVSGRLTRSARRP